MQQLCFRWDAAPGLVEGLLPAGRLLTLSPHPRQCYSTAWCCIFIRWKDRGLNLMLMMWNLLCLKSQGKCKCLTDFTSGYKAWVIQSFSLQGPAKKREGSNTGLIPELLPHSPDVWQQNELLSWSCREEVCFSPSSLNQENRSTYKGVTPHSVGTLYGMLPHSLIIHSSTPTLIVPQIR